MALPATDDTIAAIATAPGRGAIGIVRISGAWCYRVADALFAPASGVVPSVLGPDRVTFGRIVDGDQVIDEGLLLTFRAPRSYTGDDTVELQTHGGPAVLRRVLDLCLSHGARPAGPGEFTLRAYLNGRLDLAQAESVLAIVEAESEHGRRMASAGLTRELSAALDAVQSELTAVLAGVQAMLDYPEEGVEEQVRDAPLARAAARIATLLATADAGRLAREGASLALIGSPNVGKSSLLNALLGYERSLVSDRPGTTRDYLEASLTLAGLPITLIDTAGLRTSDDAIEAAGVALSRMLAARADLTLLVLDRSAPLDAGTREQLRQLDPNRSLVIANKADLAASWHPSTDTVEALEVSAVTGSGLPLLRSAIESRLLGDAVGSGLWIGNERHVAALQAAADRIEAARIAPDDLAGLDIEEALQALGRITGRSEVAEETLAEIFARFCVGK
jgi:tRNA modification GTPase